MSRNEISSLLLKSCPSFEPALSKAQQEYGENLSIYVEFGAFAHHIVDLYKRNQTGEFATAFAMIELLHQEGDESTREAATVGILEGIQNVSGNSSLDPEFFRPFLLPESLRCWNHLNQFWSGADSD